MYSACRSGVRLGCPGVSGIGTQLGSSGMRATACQHAPPPSPRQVVKVRAESMAAAARVAPPHGMLSVVGLGDADLEAICAAVRASKPNCVCQLANFLFPQGRVVSGEWGWVAGGMACGLRCARELLPGPVRWSGPEVCAGHETDTPPAPACAPGHKEALEEVQRQATARGALKAVPVAVSGAFHTPLMQPAREALTQVQAGCGGWWWGGRAGRPPWLLPHSTNSTPNNHANT
jgi:hypothetical protein